MLCKKRYGIALILLVIPALFASTLIKFNSTIEPAAFLGITPDANAKVPVTSMVFPSREIAEPDPPAVGPAEDRQQELEMLALIDFSSQVAGGRPDLVTGVFLNSEHAYPVVQQPPELTDYVSTRRNEVTQFAMADEFGTIGLLAHNYLAGISFSDISLGQDIFVVYGDGATVQFTVTSIRSFQALQPDSPSSDFIDLETRSQYTANDVFNEIYGDSDNLVLQTCIAGEDSPDWGRLFVIAERIH